MRAKVESGGMNINLSLSMEELTTLLTVVRQGIINTDMGERGSGLYSDLWDIHEGLIDVFYPTEPSE